MLIGAFVSIAFISLQRVAEGKVSLGRIHVAASDPLHMKCETADDFKRFAAHVQHKQQEMVVVSNYHLQATAKLLKIDPNATKDGMIRLGCKFWPDVESTRSGCSYRLELPDDPSDLCTIMLQCSHTLAPLLHSTRPKWSAWLNRLDPVGAGLIWTGEASTQLIADSIAALFDDADDCVEQAISLLNANGFSSPKLEHLLQTAKRLSEKQTPLPLLRAAASRVLNESRVQDALHISLHDASHKLILSGQPNLKLADSDEVLGSWGFQDSGFLIQASKKGQHFVTMKGNRYGVCGKPLTNLLPFIETEMQVRVNPLHEAFACPEIWLETTSSKFEATTIAKLRSIMSRASFSTLDRARHGTGHSQEDVFLLRSGTAVRIPDAVVWPSSEQEVETLVALAKVNCWCLIPFGGGTNVSNATRCPSEEIEARPIISVDMKEMSRILWLNEEDGLAHVQAGITGRELVEEMARRGFTIGHEPDSIEFSTLGGWIATKASGMKRSKYGNIEDIVKSVRVVGSKGMLWKGDGSDEVVPGRVAEGLDLCSFMIGSEGCLGVITSAVIRVWPMPEAKEHESVILPCFEHGLRFMRDVVKLGQNIPASVRLLDNEHFRLGQALRPESSFLRSQLQNAILKVATYWNGPLDHKSVVCATICYEGSHEEVQAQKRSMKRLASMYGGMMLGSRVGKAGYDLTFMIAYLRDFAMTYHFLGESFETFCPWSKIETLIEATKKRIVEEHCSRHLPGVPFVGCRVTQLYHEGACLYFYFCMNFEGVQNASEVFAEIERAARQEILKQGGSLSHHHGIGKIRAPLMKGRASSAFDHAMASVKKGMDQDNIFGARNGPYSSCSDS
jgi:alkyldihydroxyacetonephosphate synthase